MSATAASQVKGSSSSCRRRASSARRLPVRSRPARRSEARFQHDVRKKSMNKLKDKIREKTGRCRGVSLEQVIANRRLDMRESASSLASFRSTVCVRSRRIVSLAAIVAPSIESLRSTIESDSSRVGNRTEATRVEYSGRRYQSTDLADSADLRR